VGEKPEGEIKQAIDDAGFAAASVL